MKLKVLYFLPLVAAAMLFTFCTRESNVLAPEAQDGNQSVDDRTKCLVSVTVNVGAVNVCGTNLMLTGCNVVFGEVLFGNENVFAPVARVYGIQTASGPTPDGYLVLTNLNPGPAPVSNVTIATASGSINVNVGAAPVTIRIDSACVPTIV